MTVKLTRVLIRVMMTVKLTKVLMRMVMTVKLTRVLMRMVMTVKLMRVLTVIITPRACARGKAISYVVVVDTKISKSGDLGT